MFKYFKSIISILIASVLLTIGVSALEGGGRGLSRFWQLGESNNSICPEDMVPVISPDGDFCVDRYEAGVGSDCPAAEVLSQNDTRLNLAVPNCRPVSKPGLIPWRFVSRPQAQELCARAGKRLPQAKEWYYASLGTPDKDADWTSLDCQVADNWPAQPGLTGTGANCLSGSGAYDMIGNVWEWTLGQVDEGVFEGRQLPGQGFVSGVDDYGQPYASRPEPELILNSDYIWMKDSGQRAVARGGYFQNREQAGIYAWYAVSDSTYAGTGIGFRCVK